MRLLSQANTNIRIGDIRVSGARTFATGLIGTPKIIVLDPLARSGQGAAPLAKSLTESRRIPWRTRFVPLSAEASMSA